MSHVDSPGPLSDDKRRLLEAYLSRRTGASRTGERAIAPRPAGARVPLSLEQELIWIHSKLAPELPLYNEILTVRRRGALDVGALERSLSEVVRRHEAWRTTFEVVDGEAVQIVHPPPRFSLPVCDVSGHPEAEREAEATRVATEEAQRPLDLVRGPVVRAKLVRMAEDDHRLYVIVHQIVHDGVAVYAVFLPELVALYEAFAAGAPSPLPELDVQYGDYSVAQRRPSGADSPPLPSLQYWRTKLAGAPSAIDLPTDHARPTAQTFRGGQRTFALSKDLTEALKRLARREGATLYATLLSAFKVLLHRYSGQEDIVVGTAISTRRRPEVEKLLGVFLNTIVLRTQVAESLTFRDVLASVRQTAVEGLSHGDVPFHLLVRDLQPRRDPGYNPLFQVTFVLEPPMPAPRPGWDMTQMDVGTGIARVDLYLQMDERPEGLVGHVRFNADLWEAATIARMIEHFEILLEGVATNAGQSVAAIPMLTAAERGLADGGSVLDHRRRPGPLPVFDASEIDQSIPQRFARQVTLHGHRLAVSDGRTGWTYAELDRASNRVAHALTGARVAAGSRVALLLDHDAPMLAGVLGVLKCGAAYVPLDPTHPEERLRLIVADADAAAVLTTERNRSLARELAASGLPLLVIEHVLDASQAPEYGGAASPEAVAYLLYTSGSTGQPKGVAQNHRNVLHFIAAYTNSLRLGPEDRLSLLPSYSVDAGVMDIYGALLNGATLCPIDVRAAGLDGVCRRLVRDGITVYHSTPTLYRHIARELSRGSKPERARLVVLGGEEVRGEDVAAFRRAFGPDCVLVNGFGPTESTVSLQYFVDPERDADRRSVPIGYPVARTAVTLLSRGGRPGQVCGEIAIRSPHVALEYWRNPEGTRAAFLADPAGGRERVYKTGDMGRLLPDGTLEFRGRRDLQTKIQGFRVEIGEVEAALAQHPGIKEVAATVWEPAPGDKRLVAHFVAPPGSTPSQDELRRFLRRRLPVHMVPAAFVRIDALPLTPSGKVDRLSLPVPELAQAGSGAGAEGAADPSDPVERSLAEIWKRVLGVERIGTRDDFFDLGGHSIVALRMMAEVEGTFGLNLPLATLFESPTIERLADVIRAQAACAQPPSPVPVPTTNGFSSPFVRALAERITAVLRR